MDQGVSTPKTEIAGGRPLAPFPALERKTWYRGGDRIVAYVPKPEAVAFAEAAQEAGYEVEFTISPWAYVDDPIKFTLTKRGTP